MNTQSTTHSRPATRRHGFTLVELLIVITVIGILVGLLIPAISNAMQSARQLAIRTEMVQMEQAIESFRTQYGFYPPSFEQFDPTAAPTGTAGLSHPGVSQFLSYLNRIAPNHQERTNFAGTNTPRAVDWWNKVGRHLDQRSSLVFWLSGLCKSKQFPLTGGAPNVIAAYDALVTISTPSGPIEVERDVRFDFQPGQLKFAYGNQTALITPDGVAVPLDNNGENELVDLDEVPAGSVAVVAGYEQTYGPTDGDKLFRYRDAASYVPLDVTSGYAYMTVNDGTTDVPATTAFVNPSTFQLISSGMDGESGVSVAPTDVQSAKNASFVFSTDAEFVKRGYDNLTNFANGILELYIIENGP